MYKINGTANINAIRAASEQGKRGICTFLICYLLFQFLPSLCFGAVYVCFLGHYMYSSINHAYKQQQPGLSLLDGISYMDLIMLLGLKNKFETKVVQLVIPELALHVKNPLKIKKVRDRYK